MYELSNKRGDVLAFPLRGHVPDAVDRRERKVPIVGLEVPREVRVRGPRGPGMRDLPVLLLLDPPARA